MKFKKRYIPIFLLAIIIAGNQLGCMTASKSEQEQREIISKKGGPEPQFGSYHINGRNIHYSFAGNDTLPLVVFVHGSPGSSADMLDYLADSILLKGARVVTVDRPGFGESDYGRPETSIHEQAAVLVPLIEKLRHKKVILVGHSLGGPVIARFAMDFPNLVDGLVIVAGSVDPELEPSTWWKRPFDLPLIRLLVPSALRISNSEILPLRGELEKMRPDWSKITCPVTVIQGTQDDLVDAGNADFARKMLTNSSSVKINMLENENHFIMWTKTKIIVAEILEMMNASPQ